MYVGTATDNKGEIEDVMLADFFFHEFEHLNLKVQSWNVTLNKMPVIFLLSINLIKVYDFWNVALSYLFSPVF